MAREVHPDLEPSAYGLLVRLEECGRQRATELAAYIGVGKATMSRQLRALEQLGLVGREPDPADGRAWLVTLTEEGRRRVSRVREARRARYAGRLADWDPAEVDELARLLNRLNRGRRSRPPGPGFSTGSPRVRPGRPAAVPARPTHARSPRLRPGGADRAVPRAPQGLSAP